MEFKGTKDLKKWQYENDGDGMRFNGISVYVDDCYENYRQDALLISKAPEMLEMLIKCRNMVLELMNHEEGWDNDFYELEQLIKEATEL